MLDRLAVDPQTVAVVLPRNEDQRRAARARTGDSLIVPDRVIDAQSLVAYADLVVSAGGTMNREAAILGVPTWTTFAGRLGAVDRQLVEEGRLRVLERVEDLEVVRRDREWHPPRAIADAVVEEILRT